MTQYIPSTQCGILNCFSRSGSPMAPSHLTVLTLLYLVWFHSDTFHYNSVPLQCVCGFHSNGSVKLLRLWVFLFVWFFTVTQMHKQSGDGEVGTALCL